MLLCFLFVKVIRHSDLVTESQPASIGVQKSSSKSSIKSKPSKTSLKSTSVAPEVNEKLSLFQYMKPCRMKVVAGSHASSGSGASAGTPKSASKPSVKSNTSKTSLLSISGSKMETYAEVHAQHMH